MYISHCCCSQQPSQLIAPPAPSASRQPQVLTFCPQRLRGVPLPHGQCERRRRQRQRAVVRVFPLDGDGHKVDIAAAIVLVTYLDHCFPELQRLTAALHSCMYANKQRSRRPCEDQSAAFVENTVNQRDSCLQYWGDQAKHIRTACSCTQRRAPRCSSLQLGSTVSMRGKSKQAHAGITHAPYPAARQQASQMCPPQAPRAPYQSESSSRL